LEQLTQNLRSGEMKILEVPFPALNPGMVMVRNYFSLISAGTEGKSVKDARLSMIGKARARKDEVKKVIDSAKTFGLKDTYRMVMNRLDAPSPLGYSCAGEVIAVASDVSEFKVGDRVACGGSSANHAEVIAVPKNLCAHIPAGVSYEQASFSTLGSISMQGVRQADLRMGENCVVIGLGLLGQLSMQLLQAGGIKAIGVDIDSKQVASALKNGLTHCYERNREDLEQVVINHTNGYGCDAVIITAATSSTDPIELAGVLARRKAKIVVVGAVPTGFSRKNYYNKELELRMSCSYGPGRYDPEYEEGGIDYPYEFVRWTENRNMQSFLEFLGEKKVNVDVLTSHTFDFAKAGDAYQMILDRSEQFTGILLRYEQGKELQKKIQVSKKTPTPSNNNIGLIGAGSFGQNFLLPALKGNATFIGVATSRSNNARNIADKYGFNYCTGNASEIISDKNISTIFIATRHHTHAEYVIESLKAGKNVFVEKPLCMTEDELEQIRSLQSSSGATVMVGFNRRFAPFIRDIKKSLAKDIPVSINYRINAGIVAPDHWVHDKNIGGGRIIGEACHFIDLCMHLAGSHITSVSARNMKDPRANNDSVVISLQFANGSIASVSYFSNGNKSLPKEYLEVFSGGVVHVIDDFKSLKTFGKTMKEVKGTQDKGHKSEVETFMSAITKGNPSPIPFSELYLTTLATFKSLESIASGGDSINLEGIF
jgi:predicted dehydrogenase/threonine dehydrogenase-like Zn-dependent dehydrogenase